MTNNPTPNPHENPPQSIEEWWKEDAARHNAMGELARRMNLVVGDDDELDDDLESTDEEGTDAEDPDTEGLGSDGDSVD